MTDAHTQLDRFSVLPNAQAAALFDDAGPYPCDRCGKESADLASPTRYSTALWCKPCRATTTLCLDCGDEIDVIKIVCDGCSGRFFSDADRFGDD